MKKSSFGRSAFPPDHNTLSAHMHASKVKVKEKFIDGEMKSKNGVYFNEKNRQRMTMVLYTYKFAISLTQLFKSISGRNAKWKSFRI